MRFCIMGMGNGVISSSTSPQNAEPPRKDERLFGRIYEIYESRKAFVTVPGPEDFRTALVDLACLRKDKTPSSELYIRVEKFLYNLSICMETFMHSSVREYQQKTGSTKGVDNMSGEEDRADYLMYIVLAELDAVKELDVTQGKDIETGSFDEKGTRQLISKIGRLSDTCSEIASGRRKNYYYQIAISSYQYAIASVLSATVSAFDYWLNHDRKSAFQDYQDSLSKESKDRLAVAQLIHSEFQKSRKLHSKRALFAYNVISDVHAENDLIVSKVVERWIERFLNPVECERIEGLGKRVKRIQEDVERQVEEGRLDLTVGDNKEKKQFLDDMVEILDNEKLSYKERQMKLLARIQPKSQPSEKLDSDVTTSKRVQEIDRFFNPFECLWIEALREDVQQIKNTIEQQVKEDQFDLKAGHNKEKKQFLDDMVEILDNEKLSYKERETALRVHTKNPPVKVSAPPKEKDLRYCAIWLIKCLFFAISKVRKQCTKYLQEYDDGKLGYHNRFFCDKVKRIANPKEKAANSDAEPIPDMSKPIPAKIG